MIPILYTKGAKKADGNSNGLGFLAECIKCEVTEERNGVFEATMQYPMSGALFAKIEEGCIIKIQANDGGTPQLFRIYKSSKPIGGVVTFSAEHISYALNGLPIAGLSSVGNTAQTAMRTAFLLCPLDHEFTAYSDLTAPGTVQISTPCSLRSCLGGIEGSILDVFGGEFEFDNYDVHLWKERGQNAGVTLRYGKNLTDLKQEKSISNCYTHLYPYAKKTETSENGETGEEITLVLPEGVLPLIEPADVGHDRTLIYDFSGEFSSDEPFTEDALRAKAEAYIEVNDLKNPTVNITVSFVALAQTEDYKDIAPLERVRLCDTVNVYFEKLGITAHAKVIKTVYDALAEKYTSIEIGTVKANFASTVKNVVTEIKKAEAAATAGDALLSARLAVEAQRITAEVTRATKAEGMLSSLISQTATEITAKVEACALSEAGKAQSFAYKLTAEGFQLIANNETVFEATKSGVSITGDIIARSLTLQEGVKIPYDHLSGTPDLTVYISKDGTVGQTPAEGSTGFVVSQAGLLRASNAVIYGTIYASGGTIGGLTLSQNSIKSANGKFNLTAEGILTATGAKISGAIEATSLTLKEGVSIAADAVSGLSGVATSGSYEDLSDKPYIPSLYGYIYEDGTVGQTPAEGATGFRVSSSGLLQASNAVIYGTIYASAGTIGGIQIKGNEIRTSNGSFLLRDDGYMQISDGVISIPIGSGGYTRIDSSGLEVYDSAVFVRVNSSSIQVGNNSSTGVTMISPGSISGGGYPFSIGTGASNIDFDGALNLRGVGTVQDDWTFFGNVTFKIDPTTSSSDAAVKNTVKDIDAVSEAFFDALHPVTFKYNADAKGVIHYGLIANEVEETLKALGCDPEAWGLYAHKKDPDTGKTIRALQYREFIALNIFEIQRLKKRIAVLEQIIGRASNETLEGHPCA